LIDGNVLIIEGLVDSEQDKILIGSAVSQASGFPIILNNLDFNDRIDQISKGDNIESMTIYFLKQSIELDRNARAQLERMSRDLRDIKFDELHILGHSDSSGTNAFNIEISSKRAAAVKNYLASTGIDPSKLVVFSKGDSIPASDSNLGKNRRVTFELKN
jgi:outer membrane protein OmpA-like peptidoglycan-associated protein